MKSPVVLFWFRRDLRLHDNAGLYHALKSGMPVVPVFIFDTAILDGLAEKKDARLVFIRQALQEMQEKLEQLGSTLDVRHGEPEAIFRRLLDDYPVAAVYTNEDYEPYAQERDARVAKLLAASAIPFYTYKDQVIFSKNEVLKDDGKPYTVFTPYSKRWKSLLKPFYFRSYPNKKYFRNFFAHAPHRIPSLESMGFSEMRVTFPPADWEKSVIRTYNKTRDIPGIRGTSRLSVHLRFGTISIRELAREAGALNETFLNELIWRDFYQMILWHFPQVVKQSFRPEYDAIHWRNNEKEFRAWQQGLTGYPIVDAGMRELNETGYMHNRVRMVVASFLTKHLLIDWRWGEAYFAEKLLDYDLAANNGGWQWAAGTGCDAAPYFRVFNPYLQTQKFDPDLKYIRKWVPELDELTYPQPIVAHDVARKRCLEVYQKALKK